MKSVVSAVFITLYIDQSLEGIQAFQKKGAKKIRNVQNSFVDHTYMRAWSVLHDRLTKPDGLPKSITKILK